MVGQEIQIEGQTSDWASLADTHLVPFQHQCGSEPFFVSAMTPAN